MGRVALQRAWLYALALKLEAQLVRHSDGMGNQDYSIIGGSTRGFQVNTQLLCKETKRIQPPARTPTLSTGRHSPRPMQQRQDDCKEMIARA
jgi:hypothetical protein